MDQNLPQQPIPPFHETNADTPSIGGGLPVINYWAEHTFSHEGPALWKTLLHNPHKTTVEPGNNFVQLNDEGQTHLKEADLMPEITFLAELAHRLHGDQPIDRALNAAIGA